MPMSCAASAASPSAMAACRATTSVNLFGGIKVKNDKPKAGAYWMKTLKVLSALLTYPTAELVAAAR